MKKTVVITGSTRGIGLGMAKEFLSRGHNVVVTGTSDQSVEKGLKNIGENENLSDDWSSNKSLIIAALPFAITLRSPNQKTSEIKR